MKKKLTIAAPILFMGLLLCSCTKLTGDRTLGHMGGPTITINTIWIDGTPYNPADYPNDTIPAAGASEVKIDYTVESANDLMLVNDYFVSGSTGALLVGRTNSDLAATGETKHFTGQLFNDSFLPFQCAFRVFAADYYGGTDSKGFFLNLPAKGLGDISNATALFNHTGRNFGPSQTDANSAGLGKVIQNAWKNGRYTQYDMAGVNAGSPPAPSERARSNDFGSNYLVVASDGHNVGDLVMFSPSRFNDLFPESVNAGYKLTFYTAGTGNQNTTLDDITITKFKRLDLFTASMWNSLTSNERMSYLYDSFKATTTDEIVYPTSLGYYFFMTTGSPGHTLIDPPIDPTKFVAGFDGIYYGVIWLRSMGTATTYAQYDVKIYKYWN